MRRVVLVGLGLFELAAASLLVALGVLLPGPDDVRNGFDRAERVATSTHRQVVALRDDLGKARLRGQDLNLDAVREANQSLGSLASGLDAWAAALDSTAVQQLTGSAGRLASFLDEGVAPAAARSAQRLEKA